MISFTIKGIRTELRFSFLLFNSLIFLIKDQQTILCFYGGCIIHELGHILAAAIAGIKTEEIILSGTGITINAEKNAVLPLNRGLFLLLSGPAVNIFFAGITALSGGSMLFVTINLYLCIYNLLPFPCLDGGAALELLINGYPHEYGIRILLAIIRYTLVLIPAAAIVFGMREAFPIFLILLFLNLLNLKK